MALANYIEATNPFQLGGPPKWFLRQLYDFDPSLVLIPSKQGFYYRLAQRRPMQLPINIVNDVMKEQADTQMLASRGLVPITTVLATANWSNPLFFVELQRRAPWRMGGAQKFEQMVNAQEQQEQVDKAVHQDEYLTYLSKDAWNLYLKNIGVRSHMWSPTVKSKAPSQRSGFLFGKAPYTPEVMTTWLDAPK